MTPTPKWNEELPLKPKRPLPPPKRYEIVIDNGKPVMVTIARRHPPAGPPLPRYEKKIAEIKGASLREDELREYAHDLGTDALIVDSSGGIHRPGEHDALRGNHMGQPFFPPTYVGALAPRFPGGIVVSRAKLRAMAARGQLKKPNNLVNSFRSGRLVRRKGPFPGKLTREAVALANPGAYHGLAIPPSAGVRVSGQVLARGLASGAFVMGADGTVYARSETGFLKKIGKVVKKGAKVATAPVRVTAKVTAKITPKPIKKVVRVVKKPVASAARATVKVAKKVGNVAVQAGKLTAKGVLEVARLVSSVAAQPIRIAFALKIGRPRAQAIARSKGRKSPNAQDKREAVAWGFAKMKQRMGLLGTMAIHILKFSRGVALSGVSGQQRAENTLRAAEMGMDLVTISAYATTVTNAITALAAALKFTEGLRAAPAAATPPTVPAQSYEAPAAEDPYAYTASEYQETPVYEQEEVNSYDTESSGGFITFGRYR